MAGGMGALRKRERRLRQLAPSRRRRSPRLAGLLAAVARLGGRRLLAAVLLALGGAVALYWLALRTTAVEPQVHPTRAVAVIGSGPEAVAVAADGTILGWLPAPEEGALPALPVSSPPRKARLGGTLLEQARVLAAAPPPLRSHLASSRYGESGVDVELGSGIDLRFGDASRAALKWQAAAAVLADRSVTALDYVDLQAPGHPSLGGSGHALPPPP